MCFSMSVVNGFKNNMAARTKLVSLILNGPETISGFICLQKWRQQYKEMAGKESAEKW